MTGALFLILSGGVILYAGIQEEPIIVAIRHIFLGEPNEPENLFGGSSPNGPSIIPGLPGGGVPGVPGIPGIPDPIPGINGILPVIPVSNPHSNLPPAPTNPGGQTSGLHLPQPGPGIQSS